MNEETDDDEGYDSIIGGDNNKGEREKDWFVTRNRELL